jgi:hypothetical protein
MTVTPNFNVATVNATVSGTGATQFTVQCNSPGGTGVNISSGYTAKLTASAASNANPYASAVNLTSDCTFTYGTTGLLTVTCPAAVAAALPALRNSCAIALSNDSGTTYSTVGLGNISVSGNDPG